jgi:hypothetical protein
MMRVLIKTKWLLPILLLGLAILAVNPPTSTSRQALADGPPTADGAQAQVEGDQPLAHPVLADLAAEEPQPSNATTQTDTSTHGTY